MAVAERSQIAQQSFGEFLGNAQRQWNQPKALKASFDAFTTRGPPAAEVAAATAVSSFQGAFLGGLMGVFAKVPPGAMDQMTQAGANPEMQKQMMALQQGGPFVQARNFAVFSGVNACISTGMRRWRKKEDVQNVLVSGFGSGAAFSWVSGMTPTPQGVFTSAVLMALTQGAFYKIGQRFSGQNNAANDLQYARARMLLGSLGLAKYEKQIRKGHLNDSTIFLWNDSALKEVRIPAGPRLVLLHHVGRHKDMLQRGMLPPPPAHPFMGSTPAQ